MEPHDLNKINKSFGELNLEDEFDLDDLGCYPFEQSNDTHTQTPNTSTPTRVERTAADEEARKPKSVRPRPVPSHELQFVLNIKNSTYFLFSSPSGTSGALARMPLAIQARCSDLRYELVYDRKRKLPL